jgi:alpha-glucosidase
MKKFHSKAIQVFCLALVLALPTAADWKSLGSMSAGPAQGNAIVFSDGQNTVTLTVLAPDLVRVRMTKGTSPGPDYSYAVIKTDWPATKVKFTGDGPTRTIRTSELEVRVQLAPFRIAFYDPDGRLISKDAADMGMARDGGRVRCWKSMPPDEHYFGLGEKSDTLDKRGRAYVMWNTDAYGWGANTDPLYQDIPFFLGLRQGKAYGIFFDNTYRSSFDMGAASPDMYSFGAEGGELNYYFFYGPDPKKVIGRYTELVGRMPLPARWAMGYHQCRYSYYPESTVRFIAENFRQRHIPCDAIFLDIHYMDGYRVFTWDKTRFPDPAGMISDLAKQGFRVVTIIDPGIKVDPNYFAYQEGLAGDYFVKKPDGKIYTGKVWPGESAFPDFTNAKVRAWWGTLYKGLIADGVSGIWNDMNEPSVFDVPSKTMDPDEVFYDRGLNSPHTKIHNVYGMLMSEATRDGLLKLRPNQRPLVITRDTYAGGQRYAAVWTGDNSSTWKHLAISLPEIMNLGISGITLAGADIGGFAIGATPELYARWLEAGVFYPYCRTHTAYGNPNQEPWSYGNKIEDINRRSIELRYRLLPYLYNAFHEASQTGLPVMRALLLDYPDDPRAVQQDSEFLFGDDLLVAPVLLSHHTGREVYLPRGVWYDFWSDRRYTGPATIAVEAPLDRIPLFVRGGAIVPTQQLVQYTSQASINPLQFEIYPNGSSSREYYEDDGLSFDYRHGVSLDERVSATERTGRVTITMTTPTGSYRPPARSLMFKVHAQRNPPRKVEIDGKAIRALHSESEMKKTAEGWSFDETNNVVWIKTPDPDKAIEARIEN